jgi:hypothetical protein
MIQSGGVKTFVPVLIRASPHPERDIRKRPPPIPTPSLDPFD